MLDRYRIKDFDGYYRREVPTEDPILAVEYTKENGLWRPFSVTSSHTVWDVDYCRRDDCLYSHQSGGGLFMGGRWHLDEESQTANFVGPVAHKVRRGRWGRSQCGIRLWLHSKVRIVWENPRPGFRNRGRGKRVKNARRKLSARNVRLIDRPIGGHPLEECGGDESTEWCSICDDRLPDTLLCEHLYWCDECGMVRGVGCHDGECDC